MVSRISGLSIAARKGAAATLGTAAADALRAVVAPAGSIGAIEGSGAVDTPDSCDPLGSALVQTRNVAELSDAAGPPIPKPEPHRDPTQTMPRLPDVVQVPSPARPPLAALASQAFPGPRLQEMLPTREARPVTQTDAFASIAVDPVARRDMNVAKVLTRLAVSMCSHPTMQQGSGPDRVTRLTELLESSKTVADRLLSSVAPADGHRGWLKANALEAATLMLAEQHRADVHGEIQPIAIQVEVLEAVFARARLDDSLDAVLQGLDEVRYEAATTTVVAQARVRLSTALAAWDLLSHVTSARLGAGSYRFTYGIGPEQIVEPLLKQALSMAIDFDLASPNLDVRTAHRQSCIRRAADLLGSRYVERTRHVMDWIAAPDTSLQEYRQRHAKACSMLRASILPEVISSAHEDFRAIWEVVERTQFASRPQVDKHIHSPNRPQHQEDDGHEPRGSGSSPRQA